MHGHRQILRPLKRPLKRRPSNPTNQPTNQPTSQHGWQETGGIGTQFIRQYLGTSLLGLGLCAATGCGYEAELEELDSQEGALFALSKDVDLDWNVPFRKECKEAGSGSRAAIRDRGERFGRPFPAEPPGPLRIAGLVQLNGGPAARSIACILRERTGVLRLRPRMVPRRLRVFRRISVLLTLVASAPRDVSADATGLPDSLVLQFDATASALDQTAIRFAVEKELGIRTANSGAADAATLRVSVGENGEVELGYRPERARYVRAVPLTETRDAPTLIAHLAGNMVRDEAGVLLERLAPARAPSTAAAPQLEAVPSASPAQPAPAARDEAGRAEYLTDRWLTSLLLGASFGGFGQNEGASLTIAESRRVGRMEFGLSVEAGAARVDAELHTKAGEIEEIRVTGTQLSVLASTDVRLLGRDEGQLQVGAAAGYRLGGLFAGSTISGSNGDFAFAPRVTAVFKLRGRHGLLLRGSWYVTPRTHTISTSDVLTRSGETKHGTVTADAFDMVAQVGYQVGF